MTIEEKLKHFTTVTIESVHSKCEESLNEYKADLDEQFEKHKEEAIRDSKLREKTLRDGIERKASKEYTMEQLHLKRKINRKQNELKAKIHEEIATALLEYRKKPEYKELLIKQINAAKDFARGEEINIFIDEDDMGLCEELNAACGIRLNISEHLFMGGIRAEIPKKNILIDNTFETKLEESVEKFMVTL